MSTGTGTQQDPIIAMSADPAQIRRDIRASLAHFNRTDDAYWLEKESTPAQFSNTLWHLGHNRYWEARMDPANTGSADPNLGKQPALYVAGAVPVDPPLPDPPTAPPDATAAGVLALVLARLDAMDTRLTALERDSAVVQAVLPNLKVPTFPTYSGTIQVPYLGSAPVTLTPKP